MTTHKHIIFRIVELFVVVLFTVVSLSFTSIEHRHITLSNMQIIFREPYRFITALDIEKIVSKNFKGLNGALVDTVNTETIEKKIEENPWIKNAEVFKGYGKSDTTGTTGSMKIYIEQEIPLLRVMHGANGYYVNGQGKHLPFSSSYTKNVTVYTGFINDKNIQFSILPFEKKLNADPFLSALIQQVDVQKDNELVLVPRVGSHVIKFGKPENIELKFRNLKTVYKKGFKGDDWKKYKTVTLKYKNQVVCTLK